MAGQLSIFERKVSSQQSGRRPAWLIDEATKAAGRRGIAAARAALQAALEARRQREDAGEPRQGRAA
jgi:hypothetical protein